MKNWKFRIAKCGMKNPNRASGAIDRSFNPKSAFRNPQFNKGFTLIEVIILIVMAAILLPAIIVPFVSSVKGSGKPERVTTAMYLAHQKMEEFMKFDYSNPALNTIALTPYTNAGVSTYQWQWEILYVDRNFSSSATDVNYKRILVRVMDPDNSTYQVYSVVTNFP